MSRITPPYGEYHCSRFTRENMPTDEQGFMIMVTLCGQRQVKSWDFATEFIQTEDGFDGEEKCAICGTHEDIALLLLGELP